MALAHTHPHAIRLKGAYADMRKFEEFMAEDVVVHANGSRGIATGDWIGRDAVVQRMVELWSRSGESYVMTPSVIVANDTFACVMARLQAAHPTNGRSMDVQICGLWRLSAEGLLVEHWENCDDWTAFDDFFEPI